MKKTMKTKRKIVDTYIWTANDGGDSKSYISNKRKLTKLV